VEDTLGTLDGKVAIVTGAGRGIGRGIALAFAKAGADIAVVEKDPETAAQTAHEVRALGRRGEAIIGTVRERQACETAVRQTLDALGGIDILVNNANEARASIPFVDHTDEDVIIAWESGVMATFWLMRACFPHLVARGGGSVINLGSAAGTEGLAGFAGYAAAKEGIRALTKVAAREWGPHGIRVNTICPWANSPGVQRWAEGQPDLFRAFIDRVPLGRLGDCEADIGAVAVFLASDGAAYVTGQTLFVDGGSGGYR
jgi:NAD(P)-dependent dehydrogenase (short-subunit alcohol dehydrogenase family)